jgi:iron complex outermembrane receptor protein
VELRTELSDLARYGGQTDENGRFAIKDVGPGTYTIRASFLGYTTWSGEINIEAGEGQSIVIKLTQETLPHAEVVVSFRRADQRLQPMAFSNISAEEVERAPAMKDLPVLLSRQPSVTYYSENGNGMGYSTLKMRGFGQRRLAIAINGIPQNDPEEFNVFWINFFDIQGVVEDIQIQRGAGSSLYGPAAIGGAVNIRAMPYRPDAFARVEVGGGSFNTQRYTAEINSGLIGDRVVLYGRLSRLLSDGYRDWSWTEFWRFFAGATLYGENSTLTVQAYGGPQKDGLAYTGIPKAANKGPVEDGYG